MHRYLWSPLVLFVALTSTLAQARVTAGVVPFTSTASEEYQWIGPALANAVTQRLLDAAEVNALTERQIAAAMRQDNIEAATLLEPAVAVRLGKQLGADLLVTGSYTAAWPTIDVILTTHEPKTGGAKPARSVSGRLDKLFDLEVEIAKVLAADLRGKLNPSAGGVGTRVLDAWRETALAEQVLSWQSLAPRAADPQVPLVLPKEALAAARGRLEHATKLDPGYRQAWASLGVALALLGDDKAALAAFDHAKKGKDPHPGAVLGGAFVRMRARQVDEAAEMLKLAISQRPGFLHARGTLGELYNHVGRHKEARAVFEDYLKVAPGQPWVLAQLGYTKSKLHDHVGAVADTIAAVDALPDSPSLLIELASRYIDAGKLAGAEDALRHALDKFPDEARIYVRLGYVYLLQGQDELAIPISEKGLALAQRPERRKDKGYAHLNLARAYGHRGELDRAFAHLQQAKESGITSFAEIAGDPTLKGLRDDPRYAKGGF